MPPKTACRVRGNREGVTREASEGQGNVGFWRVSPAYQALSSNQGRQSLRVTRGFCDRQLWGSGEGPSSPPPGMGFGGLTVDPM